MRLHELLDARQLGIRALHLPEGSGQREVTWTFTTDLPDPSRYLTRDQLVLSGLVWRRSAADSEGFVAVLANAGVIALVAGAGLFDGVPDDVIDACRRHNLPLLAVPVGVSFASVTAFISNTLANKRLQSLTARFVHQREMLMDVYRGQMLDTLINRTVADLGRPVWLISTSGRSIVTSAEPLSDDDLDTITAAALTAPQGTLVVAGTHGQPLTVVVVTTLGEHRVRAWLLVIDGDRALWDPAMVESVHELVAVIGIYQVQRSGEIIGEVELADRLIELLSAEHEQPETAGYLRQAGIDPNGEMVVVSAGFRDAPDSQNLVVSLLLDAVAHVARPTVGRDGADNAIAILQSDAESDHPTTIRRALQRSTRGVSDVLTVGMSGSARVEHIGGALRSARYGMQLVDTRTETDGTKVRIADGTRVGSAVQLLTAVPDHLRRVYVESVLGPLLEHDARNQGQLIPTLRVFLECAGSWVRTSELTHLHLNTVRYRIARVEKLTGRDLRDTQHRADLFIALNLI